MQSFLLYLKTFFQRALKHIETHFMKYSIVLLVLVSTFVLSEVVYFTCKITVENHEARLRSLVGSQQQVCEASFDKMWKVLKQKAQIADRYRDAFSEIYPKIISEWNKDPNLLFKFIQGANPDFNPGLYQDLSLAVQHERESFFFEQKKLISYNNEHRALLTTWPGNYFLKTKLPIQITLITSDATKAAFETGAENNVDLF